MDGINKVQINYNHKKGKNQYGKEISETSVMFNVREDDPKEAVRLFKEVKTEYYRSKNDKQEKSQIYNDLEKRFKT